MASTDHRRSRSPTDVRREPSKRSRPRIEYHAPAQEDTCPRDAGAGQAAELAALQQQLNAERAARTTAEMKASWLADKLKAVGERSKQRGHMMVRLLTAAARVDTCKSQVQAANRQLQAAEEQLVQAMNAAKAMMQDEAAYQQGAAPAAAPADAPAPQAQHPATSTSAHAPPGAATPGALQAAAGPGPGSMAAPASAAGACNGVPSGRRRSGDTLRLEEAARPGVEAEEQQAPATLPDRFLLHLGP